MTKRIDAVLSSQELLSFENGACTVYDRNGNELYSFPLGGLHFCYEKWTAPPGEYRLYFSLPTWIYGYEGSGDQLILSVYSLPTKSLRALD